jgi:hypothetical protein
VPIEYWLFSQIRTSGSFHSAVLGRERRAGADRDVTADDPVPAQEVGLLVEDVHRAAEALHHAGLLAVQLGEDRARRHALGVRVAVLAVGRDHVVVGLERGGGADAHGLLADDQVEEPTDLSALRVRLGGGFLHPPDRQHLAVQRRELLDGGLEHRLLGLDAHGFRGGHGGGHHAATIPKRSGVATGRGVLRSARDLSDL